MKYIRVGFQCIPSVLRDSVATLATMNGGEFKKPMDTGV
jgi:hypothetical protein